MKRFTKLIYALLLVIMLWLLITTMIQRFKCSKLTETELFLILPNSFIMDWHKCKY